MIKNYFKIAWRNIIKNPFYSAVNIIGLSTGLAFTLLIGAYVWGELQVNKDLKHAGSQYIMQGKWKDPNMGYDLCTIAALPQALKTQYPHLVANYYHWDGVSTNVSRGDKHFREGVMIGDSTLLSTYGFKLLYGDERTALNEPFATVISTETALKYFGKTDVVGQTLNLENFTGLKHDFMITGVMIKPAKNSVTHITDDNEMGIYLQSAAAKFLGRSLDGWNNTVVVGYLELQPGIKAADLNQPMLDLIKKNAPDQVVKNLTPYLVPLTSYYVNANNGMVKKMIFTLSFIALFILLMAVINFVNMCISRSATRMKEMGIRKVLGGLRKQLIRQFLVESVLMVMIATVTALGIYILGRPYFNDALGREIPGLFSFPAYFWILPLLLAVIVGLVAGIYPAFVLTSLKSVDSLKGVASPVKEGVLMRKSLVVFQFGTAAVVLISALIISGQINLFFGKNLGYDKDYIVYAQVPRDWSQKGVQRMEEIRYRLSQSPQVSSASLSWEIPNGQNSGSIQVYPQGADSKGAITSQLLYTDNQYAQTYHIPLKAGSFFTGQYMPGDSAKVVINETQCKALGWNDPAKAIGQPFQSLSAFQTMTICGVVADFHFSSMQSRVQPVTFVNVNRAQLYRFLSIKLRPGNMAANISTLQQQWSALMPDAPFEYHFMDEALTKLYQTEIQLKKAAYVATALAIIIVLLGVLGLISLSIQKRTREIGIRKVLGSSVSGIIALFMREFLSIVLIAGLIACPLAYLLMHQWLNDYVYRIDITLKPFLAAVALLSGLTALLIVLQTIKAALANPAKSLRNE